MPRTAPLAALAVILGAAGCTLIPEYHRPALPVVDRWPQGSEPEPNSAPLGWRDFFKDASLDDLIALALANNRDLRVAIENVAAAEAEYRITHAGLFPKVDATAAETAERIPGDVIAAEGFAGAKAIYEHEYSLGLGVMSYELDLFGKIRSESRQAYEQYLSEAETRLATQITLVAQVAAEYVTWIADREALQVSERTATAQHKAYDLTRLNARFGNGTALDVAQAESTWRTAEASTAQYRRQAAQDLDQLVLLVGAPLPPSLQDRMTAVASLRAEPAFPALPAGLPADLLQRRPDIRAAEHTLLAANANIGAARAAFFPEITLTASDGRASSALTRLFKPGRLSWSFNPEISLPIFDAGENFANLDLAHIEARSDVASYEKTIQSAFHDVSDALVARGTYRDQVEAEQHLVDADARYYSLSQLRFQRGIDNYLNVLVAENSLFAAQLDLIALNLAERQNLITLYKALGGGWAEHDARKTGG